VISVPTVSVKLPPDIKSRVDRIAEMQGKTPHAVMVTAIQDEVERQEQHDSFVQAALRSRAEMLITGKAYDGKEVLAYMKARLNGEKPRRPRLKALSTLFKTPA